MRILKVYNEFLLKLKIKKYFQFYRHEKRRKIKVIINHCPNEMKPCWNFKAMLAFYFPLT